MNFLEYCKIWKLGMVLNMNKISNWKNSPHIRMRWFASIKFHVGIILLFQSWHFFRFWSLRIMCIASHVGIHQVVFWYNKRRRSIVKNILDVVVSFWMTNCVCWTMICFQERFVYPWLQLVSYLSYEALGENLWVLQIMCIWCFVCTCLHLNV